MSSRSAAHVICALKYGSENQRCTAPTLPLRRRAAAAAPRRTVGRTEDAHMRTKLTLAMALGAIAAGHGPAAAARGPETTRSAPPARELAAAVPGPVFLENGGRL